MDQEQIKANLTPVIREALEDIIKDLKQTQLLRHNEILLRIDRCESQIVTLQGLTTSAKKTVKTTGKVKKATNKDQSDEPQVAAVAAAEEIETVPEKFPANPYAWFRKNYKESEDFRKRFITADYQAKLDADEDIQKKDTDVKKINAASAKVWKWIKEDKKTLDIVNAEHAAEKTKYEEANKQPQGEKEPTTPK